MPILKSSSLAERSWHDRLSSPQVLSGDPQVLSGREGRIARIMVVDDEESIRGIFCPKCRKLVLSDQEELDGVL